MQFLQAGWHQELQTRQPLCRCLKTEFPWLPGTSVILTHCSSLCLPYTSLSLTHTHTHTHTHMPGSRGILLSSCNTLNPYISYARPIRYFPIKEHNSLLQAPLEFSSLVSLCFSLLMDEQPECLTVMESVMASADGWARPLRSGCLPPRITLVFELLANYP